MEEFVDNAYKISEERNQMKKAYFEIRAKAYKNAVQKKDEKELEVAQIAIIKAMVMGYTPCKRDIDPEILPVVARLEPAVQEVEWTDDPISRKIEIVRQRMKENIRC